MKNIIQYFLENGIPELEKIRIDFIGNPSLFDECVEETKKTVLDFACQFLSGLLEEWNTLLEGSVGRRVSWQIKDRCTKSILTPLGTVRFPHTRFQGRETGETAYLLDRAVGWGAHARMSDGMAAALLEGAAKGSYEEAGKSACMGGDCVGRQTVMRHVHGTEAPCPTGGGGKKDAEYLYVEADEDHVALQFHEKKGDIKRYKGHADNGQIVKLVYVHGGYAEGAGEEAGSRAQGAEGCGLFRGCIQREGECGTMGGRKEIHRK